jgi:hypothetical protein
MKIRTATAPDIMQKYRNSLFLTYVYPYLYFTGAQKIIPGRQKPAC